MEKEQKAFGIYFIAAWIIMILMAFAFEADATTIARFTFVCWLFSSMVAYGLLEKRK